MKTPAAKVRPGIEILLTGPIETVSAGSFDEHFIVHRLWEAADRQELLTRIGSRIRGVAAFGHGRIDQPLMTQLPALEIVASFGVGYDQIDVQSAANRGVAVTNTPDVLTDEVADLAVGLLVATVRRLPQADRYLRSGRWREAQFPLSASLRGRTIGIVGLGRIGQAIARRCSAFGLEVAYHSRRQREDVNWRYYPSLVEMARDVDVLILSVPGGSGTSRLVDARVLDALGPNGILINVARGSVVDEPALIEALRQGKILAAGLDVFAAEPNVPSELIALDNVVLLPHLGSASVHTRKLMGQLVLDNLVHWFAGHGPLTPVPETPWTGAGPARAGK
jgi:lactate dehydrogenase-like 2-hydroxyacid dehydrogenase